MTIKHDRALSIRSSMLIGSLGFTFASLVVFSTVAFGENWMYMNLGEVGSYFAWGAMFVVLGGILLSPLLRGPRRLVRFLPAFALSFFGYVIGWYAGYMAEGGRAGEWFGAILGCLFFTAGIAATFRIKSYRDLFQIFRLVFLLNATGYFLGGMLHSTIRGRVGMLFWGLVYGLFFGAGIGAAVYLAQKEPQASPNKLVT
jgi:hypothetical protein